MARGLDDATADAPCVAVAGSPAAAAEVAAEDLAAVERVEGRFSQAGVFPVFVGRTVGTVNAEATEALCKANSGAKPNLPRRGYRAVKCAFDVVASGVAIVPLVDDSRTEIVTASQTKETASFKKEMLQIIFESLSPSWARPERLFASFICELHFRVRLLRAIVQRRSFMKKAAAQVGAR